MSSTLVSATILAMFLIPGTSCGAGQPNSVKESPVNQALTEHERDQVFLMSLLRLGIPLDVNGAPERAIALAWEACADADGGAHAVTVMGRMISSIPNVTPHQAAQFLGVSVSNYCAQHDARFRQQLGSG